jgi:hypothetical protein
VGSWRARSLGAGRLVVRRVGEARRQGEKEGRGGARAQKIMSLAAAGDQGRAAGRCWRIGARLMGLMGLLGLG